MIKKVILKIINFYQIFISPTSGYNCRFWPTCSKYTTETIQKYGILKGLRKGVWRILRCNPLNKGGIDLP